MVLVSDMVNATATSRPALEHARRYYDSHDRYIVDDKVCMEHFGYLLRTVEDLQRIEFAARSIDMRKWRPDFGSLKRAFAIYDGED